jgi:hypothetical protein
MTENFEKLDEVTFKQPKLPQSILVKIVKSYLVHRTPVYVMMISSSKVAQSIEKIVEDGFESTQNQRSNIGDDQMQVIFKGVQEQVIKIISEDMRSEYFALFEKRVLEEFAKNRTLKKGGRKIAKYLRVK